MMNRINPPEILCVDYSNDHYSQEEQQPLESGDIHLDEYSSSRGESHIESRANDYIILNNSHAREKNGIDHTSNKCADYEGSTSPSSLLEVLYHPSASSGSPSYSGSNGSNSPQFQANSRLDTPYYFYDSNRALVSSGASTPPLYHQYYSHGSGYASASLYDDLDDKKEKRRQASRVFRLKQKDRVQKISERINTLDCNIKSQVQELSDIEKEINILKQRLSFCDARKHQELHAVQIL